MTFLFHLKFANANTANFALFQRLLVAKISSPPPFPPPLHEDIIESNFLGIHNL